MIQVTDLNLRFLFRRKTSCRFRERAFTPFFSTFSDLMPAQHLIENHFAEGHLVDLHNLRETRRLCYRCVPQALLTKRSLAKCLLAKCLLAKCLVAKCLKFLLVKCRQTNAFSIKRCGAPIIKKSCENSLS